MKPFEPHFIDEMIEVQLDETRGLEKSPSCPVAFTWRGEVFQIAALLAEWRDNRRRGRMARNMSQEHAERAMVTGSWGVGRFYFRIRENGGRVFDLYYDRSPVSADDRKGRWFLLAERDPQAANAD